MDRSDDCFFFYKGKLTSEKTASICSSSLSISCRSSTVTVAGPTSRQNTQPPQPVSRAPPTITAPVPSLHVLCRLVCLVLIFPNVDTVVKNIPQWTHMLDLAETSLARGDWNVRRLDGSMTQQRRESALKVLQHTTRQNKTNAQICSIYGSCTSSRCSFYCRSDTLVLSTAPSTEANQMGTA